jgi:hypothetical protein
MTILPPILIQFHTNTLLFAILQICPLRGAAEKNNETDFLLTMNFILFTNPGYPLQNSSLGQLHSKGGIVSIVRSSAASKF